MAFSSKKMRELRERMEFSQNDLARMIDAHPNQVSRWECADGVPGTNYLERIAKALGVKIDTLFDESKAA